MSDSSQSEFLPTWQLVLILLPLSTITIMIILGNLLVLISVATQKFLQTLSNLLLVSLAIADLFVGLFILPLSILEIVQKGRWKYGNALCKIWTTADMTFCIISIFNICLIAWDRYRSITDGVEYLKRRSFANTVWKIVGIWCAALWISSPPLLGWSNDDKGEESQVSFQILERNNFTICRLSNDKGYVIHSALGSLFFPTILMLVLYVKIYRTIQQRLAMRSKMPMFENSSSGIVRDTNEVLTNNCSSNKELAQKRTTISCGTMQRVQNHQNCIIGNSQQQQFTQTNNNDDGGTPAAGNGTILRASTLLSSLMTLLSSSSANTLPPPAGFHRSKSSNQIQNILQQKLQFSLTKERRAAKILGIIMASFLICWFPFSLIYVIEPFLSDQNKCSFVLVQVFTWFGYLNSGLNPIIYTIFCTDFRKGFKRFLHIN